ncbi:hypothetical protein, partial [Brevundimonas mediterranea]|uniref:hypothetical protein n=1 Tax=Brevundimonas mediterranea TaxID=74329 RepID=UPI004034E274
LDRFILSVLRWADSSYSWRSFRGSRHRLHNLSNDLVVLENEIEEAAAFAEAYFLRHGMD